MDWMAERSKFKFWDLQDLSLFHAIQTGSEAHPASYSRVPSRGVKRSGPETLSLVTGYCHWYLSWFSQFIQEDDGIIP
jgi:hypothetical protein